MRRAFNGVKTILIPRLVFRESADKIGFWSIARILGTWIIFSPASTGCSLNWKKSVFLPFFRKVVITQKLCIAYFYIFDHVVEKYLAPSFREKGHFYPIFVFFQGNFFSGQFWDKTY